MTSLKELQGVMILLGVNIRIGPKLKYGKVYDQSDLSGTSMNTVKDEIVDTMEVFGHSDGDTPTKHQKNKKPSVAKKSSANVKFKQCGLFKDFKVNMVRSHANEENNNEEEGSNLSENVHGIDKNMRQNDRHEPSENKHKLDFKGLKYQCQDCNLVYSSKENLQNHMCDKHIVAEGKDKYQGEDCDLKSTNKAILKTHRVSSHLFGITSTRELDTVIESMMTKGNPVDGGESLWSCAMCDKKLKKKSHMQMHVEAFHIEGVTHKCDVCLSDFKTRSSLKAHVWRIHRQTGQNFAGVW